METEPEINITIFLLLNFAYVSCQSKLINEISSTETIWATTKLYTIQVYTLDSFSF